MNPPAAIVFYLVYVLGVVVLAILPNKDAGLGKTALTGAMLGAFAYATYDLTNQATLKVWATRITLIDICWGTFLTAVGASAGYLAWRWAAKTFGFVPLQLSPALCRVMVPTRPPDRRWRGLFRLRPLESLQ